MKILNNLISILVPCFCLGGTLLLTSSCSQNKTTYSNEVIEQEKIERRAGNEETIVVIEDDNDAKFLMRVAEMQLEKINLGKLAQQKGNADHVKALGKMMEEDHTKSHNEMKALAQTKSVSIPTSVAEDSMGVYEDLNDENGVEFGKNYSIMMVDRHEEAIGLFEKAASDSEDPDVRAWASEKLPTLRNHLKLAEECEEKCENMNS